MEEKPQTQSNNPLTPREVEVLRLIAVGRSDKAIADQLALSYNTEKWYVRQIFNKLGVNRRVQAVSEARSLGILDGVTDAEYQVTPHALTDREIEVLALIDAGYSNAAIAEELGISHHTVTWYVKEIFRKLSVQRRTQAVAVARSLGLLEGVGADARPRHNLPLELTSFIGRQDEIIQVQELLQANRLVTLTGFGGVGKTRLSIRVVEEILDEFPDGVWYVELAPLADPALVAQTVALTIGLREGIGQSFQDVLVTFLRARQALIVLDNCEHLIEACAWLTDSLLSGCPKLKLLASSREALGVAGEVAFGVPSLKVPEPDEVSLVIMKSSEAVHLFVTRAQAALPDFQVTGENAPSVVRICHRLDGIPLALELAASRLKMLTTEQLASRLENAFRLLTGGSRTALPRQQTLRATIDWSYQLLDEKERMLLQRLSVFAGRFSLEGVERVCAGDGLEVWEIFDLLSSLVDKSIVSADRAQGTETRYRLLETMRQYAREKLFDAGERELLRTRHLDYYAAFAEQAYPHLHGAGRLEWTQRMKQEYVNIREAVEWAFQDGTRAHLGLGIATNIADRFLHPMGYLQEGGNWLKAGLKAAGNTIPKLLQAQSYYYRLYLDLINEFDQDQVILEKCIHLCREVGPEAHRELSLVLAWSAEFSSQEDVLPRLEEAVQIARGMGPPGSWALSWALFQKSSYLCSLSQHAFDDQAYDAALESVQLIRTGDRWHAAGYWTLGIVETRRGLMDQACQSLQKSLDLSIEVEDKGGIYSSLFCLAWHFRQAGQTGQALRCCQEMYAMSELLSSLANGLFFALGMALVMHRSGIASKEDDQTRQNGLRLLALYDKIRRYWHSFDHEAKEQVLEQLRRQMGEAAYQAVWVEGQAMTQDEGVAYAGWLLEKYAQKEK